MLARPPCPSPWCLKTSARSGKFVRSSLEAEGWQVVEAGTIKQGLVEADTRRPALVIADLGLPDGDGDGVDFIREVRAWSGVPDRAVRPHAAWPGSLSNRNLGDSTVSRALSAP